MKLFQVTIMHKARICRRGKGSTKILGRFPSSRPPKVPTERAAPAPPLGNETVPPCLEEAKTASQRNYYVIEKWLFNLCNHMLGKQLHCSNSKYLLEYKVCSILSNYISRRIPAVLPIVLFPSLQSSVLSPDPASAQKCQETVCAAEGCLRGPVSVSRPFAKISSFFMLLEKYGYFSLSAGDFIPLPVGHYTWYFVRTEEFFSAILFWPRSNKELKQQDRFLQLPHHQLAKTQTLTSVVQRLFQLLLLSGNNFTYQSVSLRMVRTSSTVAGSTTSL